MSKASDTEALKFIREETQFHLGFLPTEQPSPLTAGLDRIFECSAAAGVAALQSVDRKVLEMSRIMLVSAEFNRLCDAVYDSFRQGKRVIFSGCGATGRLAILLETLWRDGCLGQPETAAYADQVYSIMTGGDFAMIKAVEFFEDYAAFGRRQAADSGVSAGDTMIAITEGGETSSVLGTLLESLERGAKGFLVFNNPAGLLRERLERSRELIDRPEVTVLDLFCGEMAIAGSTRMQATTAEQLILSAMLEKVFCRLCGAPEPGGERFAGDFQTLLESLEKSGEVIARYCEFESGIYRESGLITYFVDRCMLDVFTDTTERTPTFMLPPFRAAGVDGPEPWSMVKNPFFPTRELWGRLLHRAPRCLEWREEDYRRMRAPERMIANPPAIDTESLYGYLIGNEDAQERYRRNSCAGVAVTVDGSEVAVPPEFACRRVLNIGRPSPAAQFNIAAACAATHLQCFEHLAVKLAFNTISTGVMVQLGRVSGNWMSFVAATNKKLIDRATRLLSDLGAMSYEDACKLLFACLEEQRRGNDGEPPVRMALKKLGKLTV